MKLQDKFEAVQKEILTFSFERYDELHCLNLATIAGLNVLLLGPPGVGKSMVVREYTKRIVGGTYFDILLTKFSTPEEVFGPFSLKKLEEDKYERIVEKRAADSQVVFVDEVFKANSGILNSLLEVMNERTFTNGTIKFLTPIITIIGASNEIPETDDKLEALYDRFHFRLNTQPIQEPGNFIRMLMMAKNLPEPINTITLDDIAEARRQAEDITISEDLARKIAILRQELQTASINPTDRTFRLSMRALKAKAWYHGEKEVLEDHLDILRHMFWTEPKDSREVYIKILELVNPEKNVIREKYEECMKLGREVLAIKQAKKQMEEGIEVGGKIKDARQEIDEKLKEMQKKKKNTEEVEQWISEIDNMLVTIFKKAYNFNVGN